MNLRVGARSDVGRVREGNEDAYVADAPIFVVADGMGGHAAGDVASATAVDVIKERASEAKVDDPATLSTLLREANRAIWEKARDDPSLRGMGTTCTLVMIDGGRGEVAHVGDSRAYLLRDGDLSQLTEDHTLVGRMVKEGRLRKEEAEHHPQRNIITRVLGIDADVEVDLAPIELAAGDRLLLTSDGLTSMVGAAPIQEVLRREADPQSAADRLVDLANDAGGDDNITVVVIDVTDSDDEEAARAPTSAPAVREDTEPGYGGPRRSRWRRRATVTVIALVVLLGGGYATARYFIDNSWYVGANDDGFVTVYRGIPDEIAGMDFKDDEETTDIALSNLPESTQENVRDGIKADSRADAEHTVDNLRTLAKDFDRRAGRPPAAGASQPSVKPTGKPSGKKRRNF